MFAPSLAAFSAMAFPIPRLAPVINIVLPASFLKGNRYFGYKTETLADFPKELEERLKIDKTLPCVQHFSAKYNTTRGVHNTIGQRVSECKDRGWFSR